MEVAMETLAIIAPEIWRHAVDTFSTEERAWRWMRQPLAELDDRTPEQVLLEDPHSDAVEAVLTRIDYGVYG
jgi:putative toxin-antitoxin system antitoxin component (TIGR02293 family)